MSNNINWRLQICSHKEIFANRDAAMLYIDKYFTPDSLVGEPTLYFYGDTETPNVIMAFGVGDRRVATIDIGKVNDKVDEIVSNETTNSEELEKAVKTLQGVITSAGLTFDENKKENQVTYEPDPKDDLIGDSESLADAIAVISKFAQENFKTNNLIPVESKSIAVSYTATDKGMKLKPSVKISTYGDSDTLDDNNNIIGLKSDGIYATVNLEYDSEKNELSFVTSGVKNGKFMDDANRKVIDLGKHTQYTPDNNGYNVNLVVDKDKNTISANVKISEDANNILKVQDDKLIVDGRASNIKYKDNNVLSALNTLEESVRTVQEHVDYVEQNQVIVGDTTDSMVITASKENKGYKISGGVRLGDNKTIIHKDGGLEIDIEITSDLLRNKLIVRTGNVVKEIDLPAVDFIQTAYYDNVTQELVIEFNNGNTVRIPMTGLITTYSFENRNTSPVVFLTSDGEESTKKIVTATLKLASTDNMLSIANGELIVRKSLVDSAVETEKQRAELAEKTLTDNLNAEIERAKSAEQANATAISDNSKAISEVNVKVDTNTEAIKLLNADDATDGSVKFYAKYVYDAMVENVANEKTRAEQAESGLSDRINVLDSKITSSSADSLTQAKAYTDSSIKSNNLQIKIDIDTAKSEAILAASEDATSKMEQAVEKAQDYTNDELVKKANKEDVYTKKEIDNKGFLTIANLSDYALKTELTAETNRATAAEKVNADNIDVLEDRALAIENSISLLQAEDKRLNISTNNTNSLTLLVSKQDSGTVIQGDVKLKTDIDNIIKLDGNGLYSNVALAYNKAENRISLVINGSTVNEFELSEHSIVQDGYYDSASKSIILVIAKDGGETQQITIPVSDIINEWTVANDINSPITLTKRAGSDGVDVLRAALAISTEAHNAILNKNATLYVSNQAKDLTALWSGDEITIQKAIENLKTEADKVPGLVSDVDTLKSDMIQVKNNITVLQGDVDTLEVKVEKNTENIAENTGAITNLTTQVNELHSTVTNLSNKFEELNDTVNTYETRIESLENSVVQINENISNVIQDVSDLQEQLGDKDPDKPSIYERLNKIEEILNNLIDFGIYR